MNKRIRVNGNLYEAVEGRKEVVANWYDDLASILKNFREFKKEVFREIGETNLRSEYDLEFAPNERKYLKDLAQHIRDVESSLVEVGIDLGELEPSL